MYAQGRDKAHQKILVKFRLVIPKPSLKFLVFGGSGPFSMPSQKEASYLEAVWKLCHQDAVLRWHQRKKMRCSQEGFFPVGPEVSKNSTLNSVPGLGWLREMKRYPNIPLFHTLKERLEFFTGKRAQPQAPGKVPLPLPTGGEDS